jgi:hypothetical protein
VLVFLCAQDIMELQGEAVEVADMEWTEVVVEGIVVELVVDCKIAGWLVGLA